MSFIDFDDGSRIIQNVPIFFQGNTNTCSQASMTAILNYWGYPVTYDEVISETSNSNMSAKVSPELVVGYLKRYGLQANAISGTLTMLKNLIDKGLPSIIGFDELDSKHFVVFVGYNDYRESVFYNDSEDGEMIEESYTSFINSWKRQRLNSSGFFANSVPNLLIQVYK